MKVEGLLVGCPEVARFAGERLELLVDGRDVALHGRLGERREVAKLAFETSLILVNGSVGH